VSGGGLGAVVGGTGLLLIGELLWESSEVNWGVVEILDCILAGDD
jgi:hypothetical protein